MKTKVKVACMSDIHGALGVNIAPSDILIIAGDICPVYSRNISMCLGDQEIWLRNDFKDWVKKQPVKDIVLVAGNHDWYFEKNDLSITSKNMKDIGICYLQDSLVEIQGLKIYGSPFQPKFCNWAFNKTEEELKQIWENIPNDLDILVTHGPPYGILDKVEDNFRVPKSQGSKSLAARIKEIDVKYSVFGHIHEMHGMAKKYNCNFVNCSLLDERYELVNDPIYISIER